MSRNRLLPLWFPVMFGILACSPDSPAPKPNIILAMADDQGWGDMAYNSHPVLKTPTFDEMAAAGLRFDRFYAAAPVCSPTRGSVMTGRHPNRFGCFRWGYSLRPQEVTVAEALRDAGYATGHFGKWHLGSVRSDSPVCPGNSGFDEWMSSPNFFENDPWMSHNGKAVKTEGEGSEVTVKAALEFIRGAVDSKRPFLAVVWFGSPHSPHVALQPDLDLYPDQPEKMRHFLGEITAMDRAMGLLRREIRQLGIADNTLLWYTSDNGAIPQGSTGGLKGRKGSIWEGGLRVPAIIEWPARAPAPRTIEVPAGTVDIYPTLLDIAGVSVENQPPLDGVSILPLIEGRGISRTHALGFWDYPAKGQPVRSGRLVEELAAEQAAGNVAPASERLPHQTGLLEERYSEDNLPGHAAWLDGNYKLHRIPAESGPPRYSLFDLAQDPAETTDLIDQEPDRAEKMKAELDAWQKSVIRSLNGEDYR
ncbi:MAG: sulfatase-like hydrolase/transferase [bacterium]|nr:sulfatase-like hydrolase/transferase [bacterium]